MSASFALKTGCFIGLFCFCIASGFQRVASYTAFCSRPILQYASFLWPKPEEDESLFFLMPVFTHSMHPKKYAPTLLFGGKCSLQFAGDNSSLAPFRDIRAEWLGASSTAQGSIACKPEQSLESIAGGATIALRAYDVPEFFQGWIVGVRTALTRVKQSSGLFINATQESDAQAIANFLSPLHLQYAGIGTKSNTLIGLENITLTLGNKYYGGCDTLILDYYSGIEIPTQSSTCPGQLFAPVLGNNGHWGLLAGFNVVLKCIEKSNFDASLFFNGEGHFLIHKWIERTCDLYGKPWSRYLPVVRQNGATGLAVLTEQIAETVTTVPVRVHPLGMIDLSVGAILNAQSCNFRIGYNLWGHQKEYTDPQDRLGRGQYDNLLSYGIAGTPGNTASASTIAYKAPDDDIIVQTVPTSTIPIFVSLDLNALDYDSAGYPMGYSQTLFGSIALFHTENTQTSFGGWIEYGQVPFTMSRYGFWVGIESSWQ